MRIVSDNSVAAWVATKLPRQMDGRAFAPGSYQAFGVVDQNEKPILGVVFYDYFPQWQTMQFSAAAENPTWAHRDIVKGLLAYPFLQVGLQKLWTANEHTNKAAHRMCEGMGFKKEGTLARHFGPKAHAVIWRMFREDYDRLYGDKE